MCYDSFRVWRAPALVAVLAIVVVSCFAAAEAQPAAHRSEATANSADNELRQPQSPLKSHNPSHRRSHRHTQRMFLCGSQLRDKLAEICNGVYNGPPAQSISRGTGSSENRVTNCCKNGCTRSYLKSFCNTGTNDSTVSESDEQSLESTSYEVEHTVTSDNELRTNSVLRPEEPKSVSTDATVRDTKKENEFRKPIDHKFSVKTIPIHLRNNPATPERQSAIYAQRQNARRLTK